MTVWVVRAGSTGEYEETCLSLGLVGIDFRIGQSATDFESKDALQEHIRSKNAADQVWRFVHDIHVGDMMVLPRKSPKVVHVGRVSGEYQYRDDLPAPHVRPVIWDPPEIPRTNFDQDLLNSMGSLSTVFRLLAPDAEERISGIVTGYLSPTELDATETASQGSEDTEDRVDLEEAIHDRIVERIRQKYPGVRLEYFVAEILRASGYRVLQTREGPDGGIDVLAGQGELGFDHPRLCVQVKSGRHPVDLPDYNRLQGNITSFGADYGLLVSLGGFTSAVRNENERSYFQVRLWRANDLVDKLLETYDRLPNDIRSEIPLRTVKMLIETE